MKQKVVKIKEIKGGIEYTLACGHVATFNFKTAVDCHDCEEICKKCKLPMFHYDNGICECKIKTK